MIYRGFCIYWYNIGTTNRINWSCSSVDGLQLRTLWGHLAYKIAHDYRNIDLKMIWELIQYDLPRFKTEVRKSL